MSVSIEFLHSLLDPVATIAEQASDLVIDIYRQPFLHTNVKSDSSPVTIADVQSENLIEKSFQKLTPDIPMIGEEAAMGGRVYPSYSTFWLVDPLDATREFISHHGTFSINMGLVYAGKPVLGAIANPLQGEIILGIEGKGLWKKSRNQPLQPLIRTAYGSGSLTALTSHRAPPKAPLTDILFPDLSIIWKRLSSAVKFSEIARGNAQLYPRKAGIKEWDTAAGHALLKAVGGDVVTLSGESLTYGKPSFSIPDFVAAAPEILPLLTQQLQNYRGALPWASKPDSGTEDTSDGV